MLIQVPRHFRILRALPSELPSNFGLLTISLSIGSSGGFSSRGRSQLFHCVFPSTGHHRQTVREVTATQHGRMADIGQGQLWISQRVGVLPGQAAKRLFLLTAHQDQMWTDGFFCSGSGDRGLRRLLNNHMRIGPAHPKCTHARDLTLQIGPFCHLGQDFDGRAIPSDMWIGIFEIHLTSNAIMLHRQQHLHDASHPSRGFQVANISLHRPDEKRIVGSSIFAQGSGSRLHLNRVPQLGSCTVGFQIRYLQRCQPRFLQSLTNDLLLSLRVGCG